MICAGSTPFYKIKYFETLEFDQYCDFLMCFLSNTNYILLFKEFKENLDSSWIENMGWDIDIQEEKRNEEKEWEQFVQERKLFTPKTWSHPFYDVIQENLIFFSPKNPLEIQQILKKKHGLVNDTCIFLEKGRKLEDWTYILTFVEHVFDEDNEDEYWAVFIQEKTPNQFEKEILPVLKEKFQITEE